MSSRFGRLSTNYTRRRGLVEVSPATALLHGPPGRGGRSAGLPSCEAPAAPPPASIPRRSGIRSPVDLPLRPYVSSRHLEGRLKIALGRARYFRSEES